MGTGYRVQDTWKTSFRAIKVDSDIDMIHCTGSILKESSIEFLQPDLRFHGAKIEQNSGNYMGQKQLNKVVSLTRFQQK